MGRVPSISDKQENISKKNRDEKLSKRDKIKLVNSNDESKMRRKKHKFSHKARAAIYIGHIPHGFYEDQMREYFNQFGKVHSAVVIRSEKTGRSRGYGFVEFEDEEVAKIAAETMNNYLMFNRILKCRYIPPEERKGPLYVRPIYYVLPKVKNRILSTKNKKKAFQLLDQSAYLKKAQKKINDFKKFFEERGVDFSFKVNFPNLEDNKTDEPKNVELESSNSCGSKSEENVDDQFGVLEIDESDNDIHFKTPPQVKKIIKRSSTRATSLGITPTRKQTQVEEQRMKLRNSNAPEIRKHTTPERKKISNGIGRKLEKTTKVREKPLVKSLKPQKAQNKKGKSLKKDGGTMVTRKKGKDKEKKGSENKQRK